MMDERNQWLLHLYEGTGDPPEDPGEAAASLREMKALLDARPKRRPDADAVDAVLAVARGEVRGARRDRPPARRIVGLRVGAASAAAAVLIALVGILQLEVLSPEPVRTESSSEPVGADSASESAGTVAAPERAELQDGTAMRGREGIAAVQRSPGRAPVGDLSLTGGGVSPDSAVHIWLGASDPVPSWDERGDVIELYRRIERIGGGVERGWEAPPVPLEMLPSGQGTGFMPVGQPR